MAGDITHITVHCSASPPTTHVDAKVIDRWHRARGFLKIGYHFVIRRDGVVEKGRDIKEVGAHVANHNTGNLGICLAGGVNKEGKAEDNFTTDQLHSLALLLQDLKKQFPKATILGHRDWPGVKKDCPSFDVRSWLKETGVLA
jgi:N-acetyl-anhydromuramyl-L-alanine amidase AmpD